MIRRMLSLGVVLAAVLAASSGPAHAGATGAVAKLLKYNITVSNVVGTADTLSFRLSGSPVDASDLAEVDTSCWAGQEIMLGRSPLEITARRPKFIARGALTLDGTFSFPLVGMKEGRYVAVLRPLASALNDPNSCRLIGYSNTVTVLAPADPDLPL